MEANASLPKAEKRRNDYSGFSKTLFDRGNQNSEGLILEFESASW